MPQIQALNAKTSPNQQPYRITVWAGSESAPGVRGDWAVYSSSIPAAIAKAVRSFRKGPAKGRRFSDWTVNVEPMRADDVILPSEKGETK